MAACTITGTVRAATVSRSIAMAVQSGSVCPVNCARGVTSNPLPVPPCLSWQRVLWVASVEQKWPMPGVLTATVTVAAEVGGSGDAAGTTVIASVHLTGTSTALQDQCGPKYILTSSFAFVMKCDCFFTFQRNVSSVCLLLVYFTVLHASKTYFIKLAFKAKAVFCTVIKILSILENSFRAARVEVF